MIWQPGTFYSVSRMHPVATLQSMSSMHPVVYSNLAAVLTSTSPPTRRTPPLQTIQPTPGQPTKDPVLIPVRMGLLGPDGRELPLKLRGWVVCGRHGCCGSPGALACDGDANFGALLYGQRCVSFHCSGPQLGGAALLRLTDCLPICSLQGPRAGQRDRAAPDGAGAGVCV